MYSADNVTVQFLAKIVIGDAIVLFYSTSFHGLPGFYMILVVAVDVGLPALLRYYAKMNEKCYTPLFFE